MSKIITTVPLTDEDKNFLKELIKTRTIQAQIVDRVRMLLFKSEGKTDKFIAEGLGISINTVRRCTSRYLEGGLDLALYDDERIGRPVEITDDAIAWMVSVACQKPCELGYAAERWTLSALHRHIQKNAVDAGYTRLAKATKPWLQKTLRTMDIKPFKIRYYLERKDPDFDAKMHEVLLVYKQVEMQFDDKGMLVIPESGSMMHTLSYDEKPGLQAIANKLSGPKPNRRERLCQARLRVYPFRYSFVACRYRFTYWGSNTVGMQYA